MKRLFNHTKRPDRGWDAYDNNGYDWDEDIEEYYEEDSEASYAEDGAYEETPIEEESYEEAEEAAYADAETVYSDEEPAYEGEEIAYSEEEPVYEGEEAVYEEAEPLYSEDGGAYEAGEDYADSDAQYEDGQYEDEYYEEEYYEEEEPYYEEEPREKKSFFANLGVMDLVIAGTGVAVIIVAIITAGVYVASKNFKEQISSFATVGTQLEGIDLIGGKGLLAVADAQLAKIAAANAVAEEEEEEDYGYDENDYNQTVSVSMTLTSVQKDLKIKFSNKETGKLISNVPFAVTVTKPDKSTEVWTDDDMDGIIYKKDLTPGDYSVAMSDLDAVKYSQYMLSTVGQSVEVKKNISYNKIDVSNEVKKESEINVSKEDTKKNETVVESTLTDTVEWVESTATANTYKEVAKSTIPDPITIKVAQAFLRTAAGISSSNETLVVGGSCSLSASYVLDATGAALEVKNITWSSSNTSVATVSSTGTVEAVAAGSASISYSGTVTIPSVSGNGTDTPVTGTCMVTVSDAKGTLAVDNGAVSVAVNGVATVKASASGYTAGKGLTYSVSVDNGNATAVIDASGNIAIAGKAAGTATVTVSVNYTGGSDATKATATIAVTVGGSVMTIDKTSATVYVKDPNPTVITATIATASSGTLSAESSDTNVATVSVSGKSITINGVAKGTATITVKYVSNGVETKSTCAVTVKVHPKDDKETKLVDANNIQLYVLEGEKYREAVYADYYTASQFFIKSTIKYTGWQTLEGKVYYFNAKGVKVTGEQIIQGAKYNFASDGSLMNGSGTMGIDVSKWNGTIDWAAVKNSGVSYAIIRCGYRGSSQGALIEDPKFTTNIKGATEAGIKVGVYFFTQAVDEVEAVYEASYVLDKIKNYKISYPVFLDVEPSGGRGDKISAETRTAVCKAFCETIKSGGYTAGVYANKTWLSEKMDANALSAYKIWLAQYASQPSYTGRYDIWQYKSKGKVSGISGDVDLNLSYLGY